jgi:hypothetical protein
VSGESCDGVREIYIGKKRNNGRVFRFLGKSAEQRRWFMEGRRKLGINYMECTPAYDSLPQNWKTIAFLLLPLQGGRALSLSSVKKRLSLSPCVWAQPPFAPLGLCLEKVLGFFLLFASFLSIVTLNRLLEMFIISLSPILL